METQWQVCEFLWVPHAWQETSYKTPRSPECQGAGGSKRRSPLIDCQQDTAAQTGLGESLTQHWCRKHTSVVCVVASRYTRMDWAVTSKYTSSDCCGQRRTYVNVNVNVNNSLREGFHKKNRQIIHILWIRGGGGHQMWISTILARKNISFSI